jgi:SAM-dependent methyltransferase
MQEDSHAAAQRKFDSAAMAATYRRKFVGSPKDLAEKRCISRALEGVPAQSLVLDLPCGTGRITTFLLDRGWRVEACDYSDHMIAQAREAAAGREGVSFSRQDVMSTTFPDASFDAVVSNRLFHHFTEADTRRRALRELARVARGPVVVSFFCTVALSALKFRLGNALRGIRPTDRVPIPLRTFREDLEASGLSVIEVLPVRYGISPQTYVKAMPIR